MKKEEIELIQKTFDYDRNNGMLYRKESFHKRYIGWTAGAINGRGYMLVRIGKKKYPVHRLAWIISFGYNPVEIDHIDHDTTNNSMDNLREVDRKTQTKNRSISKNNKTGTNGVSVGNGGFIAYTAIDGERVHLGTFSTKAEAISARQASDIVVGYHENHGA